MRERILFAFLAAGCGDGGAGAGSDARRAPDDAASAPDGDIPVGGTLLFEEPFEDADYASRGWYDGDGGALSDVERVPGSTRSFECRFTVGATTCAGGKPARRAIPPTESVYLRFWIKFDPGWIGSDRPYHPHLFHFVTDADDDWVGPARTHLTTYVEVVAGRPVLALQDSRNVDPACILRNDGSFVGCGGDFATYPFTEQRSVAACNGLAGDVDGRDCFDTGSSWYSSRSWDSDELWFVDVPGPRFKGDWHRVEAYFSMSSIQDGVGVPDGRIRWWYDGELVIASDRILFRTGANPTIRFDQFLMLPYIGDGSPIDQRFWIDDLSIWTAPPT